MLALLSRFPFWSCSRWGISSIGTENRVKTYYIKYYKSFQTLKPLIFRGCGYLVISCIELLQPSTKSLCNKTFKLNPVFCSNDTCTPHLAQCPLVLPLRLELS